MTLSEYLLLRGLSEKVVGELLPLIPEHTEDGVFCDAQSITDPDRWFYWPGQRRFVVVGRCPNGDGVAIDTQIDPGAVFYISHELVGGDRALDAFAVRAADSASDFVQKLVGAEAFPYDFWEAKRRFA